MERIRPEIRNIIRNHKGFFKSLVRDDNVYVVRLDVVVLKHMHPIVALLKELFAANSYTILGYKRDYRKPWYKMEIHVISISELYSLDANKPNPAINRQAEKALYESPNHTGIKPVDDEDSIKKYKRECRRSAAAIFRESQAEFKKHIASKIAASALKQGQINYPHRKAGVTPKASSKAESKKTSLLGTIINAILKKLFEKVW